MNSAQGLFVSFRLGDFTLILLESLDLMAMPLLACHLSKVSLDLLHSYSLAQMVQNSLGSATKEREQTSPIIHSHMAMTLHGRGADTLLRWVPCSSVTNRTVTTLGMMEL